MELCGFNYQLNSIMNLIELNITDNASSWSKFYLEPILGTQGTRWQHTVDGRQSRIFTHLFTPWSNLARQVKCLQTLREHAQKLQLGKLKTWVLI